MSLGTFDQGEVPCEIKNLESGKTYYYRFKADNSLTSWSGLGSFRTLAFDQGVLRFDTGHNESGLGAGLFWDKEDGNGEQ